MPAALACLRRAPGAGAPAAAPARRLGLRRRDHSTPPTPKEVCLPSRAVYACNGAPESCDRSFERSRTRPRTTRCRTPTMASSCRTAVASCTSSRDGVRGFMLDTHYDGTWSRSATLLRARRAPLLTTLTEMRGFLEQHLLRDRQHHLRELRLGRGHAAVFDAAGLLPSTRAGRRRPVADPARDDRGRQADGGVPDAAAAPTPGTRTSGPTPRDPLLVRDAAT